MEFMEQSGHLKRGSITNSQKEILADFMKNHIDMVKGKFSLNFTQKGAHALWEEVTRVLNSVPGGAKKNWQQWRKTWIDMKKNAKRKCSHLKKYAAGTGGGPPLSHTLTDIEKGILELIGTVCQEGHEEVPETNVSFSFEDNLAEDNKETKLVSSIPGPSHILENTNRKLTQTPRKCNSRKLTSTSTKKFESLLSHDLLNIVKEHKEYEKEYYKKKIEFLEEKKIYAQEKLVCLQEALALLREIKEGLL